VSETIRIIITGGTFDKHYDEIRGELTFRTTHLPQILQRVRVTVPVELEIRHLIDSLDMDDEVREELATACAEAAESRIVITHGTDTMVETARMISARRLAKTVVLTGAMIPYAFSGSDAEFNLGCAFAAVQTLPHGVYVAMNGRLFPADSVWKNREIGQFQAVE
jgi:L-asparaginase